MKSITAIAALLLATAILYTGNGLQGTLLPVRGNIEGFSTSVIGLLGSAYYAGFILGCLIVPRTIQGVGHIRAFVALASIASSSALAHAIFVEPLLWAALRLVTGFSFAGLAMVLESWINERANNSNRGKILSVYRIVDLAAITAGNALLATTDPQGFHLFAIISILISLALVPVALTRSQSPAPIATAKLDVRKLYRISPVGALGATATGLGNAAFWGLGPLFVQQSGYPATIIAAFMSTAIIGAGLSQFPLGWISDRVDRRLVIIASSSLGVIAAAGLALIGTQSETTLLVFVFFFGACIIPIFGICAAHANDFAEAGEAVATSGGLLLLHGLGATAGSLLGSVVMQTFGPETLFLYIASIYTALVVISTLRIRTRRAIPDTKKTTFVPTPKSPATAVYEEEAGMTRTVAEAP